ncbi:MAG: hypothetical protein AB1478_04975 [Nitrospirota bacterium]
MSDTKLARVILHDSDLDVDVNLNASGELLSQMRANTIKDGTGTSYVPLLDVDGHLQIDVLSALPSGTNTIGNVNVLHNKTIKNATGSISATTAIVAAVTGKKIKVFAYSLIMSSTTAVTCTFNNGAAGTALWTVPLQALSGTISGANLAVSIPSFLFATGAGVLLELALSAAVSVTYSISYWDDDAD